MTQIAIIEWWFWWRRRNDWVFVDVDCVCRLRSTSYLERSLITCRRAWHRQCELLLFRVERFVRSLVKKRLSSFSLITPRTHLQSYTLSSLLMLKVSCTGVVLIFSPPDTRFHFHSSLSLPSPSSIRPLPFLPTLFFPSSPLQSHHPLPSFRSIPLKSS